MPRSFCTICLNIFCSFVVGFCCWGCGGPGEGGNGGEDLAQHPVFAASVDERYVKTVSLACEFPDDSAEDCDWEIPVNQLTAMFDSELPFGEALDRAEKAVQALIAAGIHAELVGQIPEGRIFQIEFDNEEAGAAATLARLQQAQAIVEGIQGVANVAYNFLGELRVYTPMEPRGDDNSNFANAKRKGLAAIDYYQAIPVFNQFLRRSHLNPVAVGILDSGIDTVSDQFDDVTVTAVRAPIDDTSTDYHGTSMAALIAADDNDGGMNGIASKILGDRLSLLVGKTAAAGPTEHFDTLATLTEMVRMGADLVNMSFGFSRARGETVAEFVAARDQWRQTIRDMDETLFLAASANRSGVLNQRNDFPAGLSTNNLITVGGVDTDSLYDRADHAAYGVLINVAAPATEIPAPQRGSTQVVVAHGTSGGTAMLTAMAAIMKSINPSATPHQLKQYLVDEDNGWPADPSAGDVRPSLLRTVGKYMMENGVSGATNALDRWVGGDGDPDPTGLIVNRHAAQSVTEIEISGPTSYNATLDSNDSDMIVRGTLNNTGGITFAGCTFGVVVGNYAVGAGTTTAFRLNDPYTFGADGSGMATLGIGSPLSAEYGGVSTSGSIVYTDCEMTTRSLPTNWDTLGHVSTDGPDAFIFVQVKGEFAAVIEGYDFTTEPDPTLATYNVSGNFVTPFALVEVPAATRDYLEENCIGGYQYGTP